MILRIMFHPFLSRHTLLDLLALFRFKQPFPKFSGCPQVFFSDIFNCLPGCSDLILLQLQVRSRSLCCGQSPICSLHLDRQSAFLCRSMDKKENRIFIQAIKILHLEFFEGHISHPSLFVTLNLVLLYPKTES